MKRKYADRPNWKRVTSRKMLMEELNHEAFQGNAVLIYIENVREPLWVELAGASQCVVDAGYSWLTLFPRNQSYVVTAMFNNRNEIVQWYIDICRDQGLTDRRVPWYDDLYLDIIISSDYQVALIDEDDLALALRQKIIKQEDYDFAYREANKLLELILTDQFPLLGFSKQIYQMLKEKLQIRQ